MSTGFANRQVVARTTITVNVPEVPKPAGHIGPWIAAPAATYTLTIPDTVTVKLERPLADGSKPDREMKWAITNPNNLDHIGYLVPGNQPRSDSVGHIVDRKFGGHARHNDDGDRNVFAQNSSLNDTEWNQFMDQVEQTLAVPVVRSVCLKYKFNYLSKKYPNRPSTIYIEWWVAAPVGTTVPLRSLQGNTTISNRIGG